MALLIRQKLKMENSKFVSNEKRIDETMFLSTNDLINVLRKSELPNDIYLKSVVLLLTDLAKKKTHNAFQVF